MKGYEVVNDLTHDVEEFTSKREALKSLKKLEKGFMIKYDTDEDQNEIIKVKENGKVFDI